MCGLCGERECGCLADLVRESEPVAVPDGRIALVSGPHGFLPAVGFPDRCAWCGGAMLAAAHGIDSAGAA